MWGPYQSRAENKILTKVHLHVYTYTNRKCVWGCKMQQFFLRGDFNVTLDPPLDGAVGNPVYKDSRKDFNTILEELVDIWRIQSLHCKKNWLEDRYLQLFKGALIIGLSAIFYKTMSLKMTLSLP